MSDFFATLELELRAAAESAPRRRVTWAPALRGLAIAALVAGLLAVALVPALLLLGDGAEPADEPAPVPAEPTPVPAVAPVGTVISKGEGIPPRRAESRVVATGVAPEAGTWQMEHYVSTRFADPETGEVIEEAGLPCLSVFLLDPPDGSGPMGGGQCGEFPRTPGFSRVQMTVRNTQGEAEEILVYGRVPANAMAVVITVDGESRRAVDPFPGPPQAGGDFYLIPIPPGWERGRVNWIDENGKVGSSGHALMPR